MKQLIPILFGISVLITPQFSVIADETNREVIYSKDEQLLSRAAHYKA